MKNFFAVFTFLLAASFAGAQCNIDTNAQTRPGIYPKADSLPCIVRSQLYDQTLQVQCPTYFDSTVNFGIATYPVQVTVDSMELDSIINLPSGIMWSKNPYKLKGGENGCLNLTGTTTDAPGYYKLTWYGTVWGSLPSAVPAQYRYQTYNGKLDRLDYMNYSLGVIDAGGACPVAAPNGIREVAQLSVNIGISPNPNSGEFFVTLNSEKNLEGEMQILNVAGEKVYVKRIPAARTFLTPVDMKAYSKGIYFLMVKTAEGSAGAKFIVK